MTSPPKGARPLATTEGDGDKDADGAPGARPGSVRPAGAGSVKFAGIVPEGLQETDAAGNAYPVERRGGTRPAPAPAPTAAAPAPGAPSVPPTTTPVPPRRVEPPRTAPSAPAPAATPPARRPETQGLASTGISGLDAQYGGGIPTGCLYLLTSEPTTATGVFAAQYAGAGLAEGEDVYYVSLEQRADEVRKAIGTFVPNERDMERLHLIDGHANQFRDVPADTRARMGVGADEDVLGALESLLSGPKLTGRVRIIIESLSELLAQNDEARVLRLFRVLKGVVAAVGGTAVVTLVTPLHDERVVAQAKHIADGVIEFHVERKGFGIYPYIAVTKLRGVTGSARLLLFKETESGLWLESTKRVF